MSSKSARRCGAKHISKSKVLKTGGLGSFCQVRMSKRCTPLWREAHVEVKMQKQHMLGPLLDFSWQAQRILHLAQGEKQLESFVAVAKGDGKRGALEVDLQRLISSGRRRQETCESGMFGGQGADFLRRVAFWSIRSSGSLRWFRDILWQVQHFVWPGPAFSPQAQYWWKNRKKRHWCILTRERQLSLKKLLRFWCWGISKTG